MMFRFAVAALAAASLSAPALADTIVPVAVTATDTFSLFGQYKSENLINGSGLTGGLHDGNFAAMWMTNLGVNQASLTFDLGALYNLDGARIWNYNFGNPAEFQSTILRGVKDFRLSGSANGTTFTELLSGRLLAGTGQPLAAQSFALAGTARFVRLDVLNNYGEGTYAERDWSSGLSEVRFTGAAVPEPASWALMLGGFGLLGTALRRRPTRAFA
jgi:hypothetical protein